MTIGNMAKSTGRSAAEIAKRYGPGEKAKELLRDGMTPAQYVQSLAAEKQWTEAIKFVAHALPKREAVGWALACAREAAGAAPPPKEAGALGAVEAWLRDPSEENRRSAQAAYESAELKTPAGCAAFAAFVSGGSLGPPTAPVVPPGEWLTAHATGGAVVLSAVVVEPEKAEQKFQKFLQTGLEVADGQEPWKTPARR